MADPYYVLNDNDGVDTLHQNPREQCNTQGDEMTGRKVLDRAEAERLMRDGLVRLCAHCKPSIAGEPS